MSVDLDWDNLTSELANSPVDILSRQLSSVTRPSFIVPVEVLSFDSGNVPPDVEVIGIRNVHPDFLEDEEQDDEGGPVPSDRHAPLTRQDLPHQSERSFANNPPEPAGEVPVEVEGNAAEGSPQQRFGWLSPSVFFSHLPRGASRPSPRIRMIDMFGSTPLLHRGVYPGSPWSPAMCSRLGSWKPSLGSESLHLPIPNFHTRDRTPRRAPTPNPNI